MTPLCIHSQYLLTTEELGKLLLYYAGIEISTNGCSIDVDHSR